MKEGRPEGEEKGQQEALINYIKKRQKKGRRKALNENINNEMIVQVRDRDICRDKGR